MTLSDSDRDTYEGEITLNEVLSAINRTKYNKIMSWLSDQYKYITRSKVICDTCKIKKNLFSFQMICLGNI